MQLFRVRGIPVRIDVGWILVFGLISWSLASGYFPYVLAAQSPVAYWALGLLAAVLLFSSVLLHELAHALVAVGHGVPVGGITLHIFGGVSQLEGEPETPRAEILIAIVGPFTSFAIAGIAAMVGRFLSGPAWADALTGYLSAVNLLVGFFNLLPAFPLDGGRVLRAALWRWSGRLDWASRVASRIGSFFGMLMIAAGIARAIAGEAMGGLWLALIGLFLHQAARASFEVVRLREQLEPLPVERVMNRAPAVLDAARASTLPSVANAVVSPRDSAWQAFLQISRNGLGRVAVFDDGTLVGVVSQRDLQQLVNASGGDGGMERRAA
jgi:Zn-dependent protease